MYLCTNCNCELSKWYGQCPKCKSWNSVEKIENKDKLKTSRVSKVTLLSEISTNEIVRIDSGIEQLNLVLGSGFVPGSITLFGGRPGIGKSTLILKVADHIAKNLNVLYVSGEENLGQIKIRADRLDVKSNINFINEQDSHVIMNTAIQNNIDFIVIDSIQTTVSPVVNNSSSVSQLKTVAFEMMEFSKGNNITTVLIGHVTKDGDIAGPKLLEHMVDTVLYIETEIEDDVRVLRSEKNRFGSTGEIGLLQMTNSGLDTYEQTNIATYVNDDVLGTVIGTLRAGNRQMLVEVQSLVSESCYPNPRRNSQGIDTNRLNIMIAIIQKHLSLQLTYDDVYVKMRGGIKASSNLLDLAILASIYSAKCEIAISRTCLFIGEVALTGHIINAGIDELLVSNFAKQGYKVIIGNNINFESTEIDIINIDHVSKLRDILRR